MIENNEREGPIELDKIFTYVEIETKYLQNLVERVVLIISKSIDVYESGFGPLIEGSTFSGLEGEVTEDGDIHLDSKKLRKYDDDLAMAIVAHELAHSHLKHLENYENLLEKEYEADNLARIWGFDIDKFRKTCGPPTLQNTLPKCILN